MMVPPLFQAKTLNIPPERHTSKEPVCEDSPSCTQDTKFDGVNCFSEDVPTCPAGTRFDGRGRSSITKPTCTTGSFEGGGWVSPITP